MSNEKKVWVGLISYTKTVNIYSIAASFPSVFDLLSHYELGKVIETDELKQWKEQSQKLIRLKKSYKKYRKIEAMPRKLWLTERSDKVPESSEYIFMIENGFIVVNEKCANLLKQFRLGETTLTPVHIHEIDTGSILLEDNFYFLNVCEKRHYMSDIQNNKHVKRLDYEINNNPVFDLSIFRLEDDVIEVQEEIVDCDLDLWHEPSLDESFFMSNELHNALVEAGMADLWNMHTCQIK